MSAIAFDPWAALEKSRAALPPAKTAIPAKPCPGPQPGLADLAGLAGGHVQSATFECLETGQQPTRARGGCGLAVPDEWRDGVERLATMPSPARIEPQRWAAFVATAARLLHSHGPALHRAGWGTLELFGLYGCAPAAYPPGWGLAWLLDTAGDVLDLDPDGVGMRRTMGGARLLFRRRPFVAGVLAAWKLARLD